MKRLPDELAVKILKAIKSEAYQAQIAKDFHISPPRLNQRIKTLIKNGYVRKEVKDAVVVMTLTELGELSINAIKEPLHVLNETLTKTRFQKLSQHKLGLKLRLLNKLAPDEPAKLMLAEKLESQEAGLLNQSSQRTVYKDYEIMLTPESLVIWAAEPTIRPHGYNEYKIKLEAARPLFKLALELEERLKLKFYRPSKGIVEAEIMTSHLSQQNDWGAESQPEKKRVITYDEKDKKARFGFDFSNGIPEAEGWHEDHDADDMAKWNRWLVSLTQHGFDGDVVLEAIKGLTQERILDSQRIEKEQKFFESHNALIAESKNLINELRAERASQAKPGWLRRLFKRLW